MVPRKSCVTIVSTSSSETSRLITVWALALATVAARVTPSAIGDRALIILPPCALLGEHRTQPRQMRSRLPYFASLFPAGVRNPSAQASEFLQIGSGIVAAAGKQ